MTEPSEADRAQERREHPLIRSWYIRLKLFSGEWVDSAIEILAPDEVDDRIERMKEEFRSGFVVVTTVTGARKVVPSEHIVWATLVPGLPPPAPI